MPDSRFSASRWLPLLALVLLLPLPGFAADFPWRAASQADLDGTWRQVGVVVLDTGNDSNDPWYQAKQFFRFPADGGFKHVLVNPDSTPDSNTPTEMQRFMLEAPATQTLTWRSPGIVMLKHPERPPQRIDMGLYLRDAPTGPMNSPLQPKKGDLILVFYSYRDINQAVYYRLLRRLP